MSSLSVQRDVDAGTLCAVRVRGVDLRRDLMVVRRAGEPVPEPARRLWEWLPQPTQALG